VGHERTFLPYDLFQRLEQSGGGNANASMTPFGSSQAQRQTTPHQGGLDDSLASEEAGDNGTGSSGTESRTITMDRGDTLAGALEEAGISAEDASAAVAALTKVYDVRNLRAGESFELSYSTAQPEAGAPSTVFMNSPDAADA